MSGKERLLGRFMLLRDDCTARLYITADALSAHALYMMCSFSLHLRFLTARATINTEFEPPVPHAKVQKALPEGSNGKAVVQAGWHAELLHSRLCIWRMSLVNWLSLATEGRSLAPLLTGLLNRFSLRRSFSSCVSSPQVTRRVAAHYRPTAVGEPLHRLYIIFNHRLPHWTEANGFWARVHAAQHGVRPCKSTSHHLFALRHFINLLWFKVCSVSLTMP